MIERMFAAAVWATLLTIYVAIDIVTVRDGMTLTNGDEPHYLVTTYSLVHDRDVDVLNNYEEDQYRAWYSGVLDRHLLAVGGKDFSLHGAGLSLLLVPGFALGGRDGAVLTVMAIMAFGIMQLYALCRAVVSARTAAVVSAACALSMPLIAYSRALYPDAIGFVAVTTVMKLLWDLWDGVRRARLAAAFVILTLLPWLHPRFALLSAGFGFCVLWVAWRTKQLDRLAPLLLIPVAGALFYVYGIHVLYNVSLGDYLDARSQGGALFRLSNLGGLLGVFLDRMAGLLWYAPIYLLAFGGLAALARTRSTRLRLGPAVLVCFSYFLMIGSFFEWWGGFAPPARYLVPIMAPLVLGVAVSYERMLTRGRPWKFAVLLIPTLLVAAIGSRHPIRLLPVTIGNNMFPAVNPVLPDFVYDQGLAAYCLGLGWIVAMALFVNWPERARDS